MKRLRVPIDRHAEDGQLTEVLENIVLVPLPPPTLLARADEVIE
jgi:hypothetical protein